MVNDIRYAFRTLRQNRSFALTAIISIALGIGVNSAVFSLADGLLFRPLPVPNASQVVNLRMRTPRMTSGSFSENATFEKLSYADFTDFRDRSGSFSGLAAYDTVQIAFAKDAKNQPELVTGFQVSGNFFNVLGVPPRFGRAFPEEDQVPGRDAVIVLANDFWKREFAADSNVIGSHVELNGVDFQVIGVAPESFTELDQFIRPAFFIPATMAPALDPSNADLLTDRGRRSFQIKGRLKDGVSIQAAEEEVAGLAKSLDESHPDTNRGYGAAVRTERQARLDMMPFYGMIVVQMFAIAFVALAIACANVANLMFSRGQARAREIAVRLALGASRPKLLQQFMAENLLVALAGGALGLIIAQFAVETFSNFEIASDIPVRMHFQLDARVLEFTLAVSIASAVLFGLAPALRSTKANLVSAMKTGEADQARKRLFGRSALVVVQLAGSVLLVFTAVQLYRNTTAAIAAYPGFAKDHRLVMRFDPAMAGYTPTQAEQFYKTLVDRTRETPGVKSAALSFFIPLTYNFRPEIVIPEGYEFPAGQESISIPVTNIVDSGYFRTFGVPVLMGRGFTPTDSGNSSRVAVVNRTFAQRYLGDNPIGKRLRLRDASGPWVEVVGVVETGKYYAIFEPPIDALYLPLSQNPAQRMTLIVESSGDAAALAAPLREVVRSINPNVPIFGVRTMDALFDGGAVKPMQVFGGLIAAAAFLGLVLALVGLYAIVAYQVARRTREIGIRIALGAGRPQVMKMILGHSAAIGVTGVGIGVVLNFPLRRVFTGGAQVPAIDPLLLGAVAASLLLTTLIAAWIPARRASRIDPQQALRQD